MTNTPSFPDPVDVELADLYLASDNAVVVLLQLDYGRTVRISFAPDSEAAEEILDVLSRLTTEFVAQLGSSGLSIVGFTPPDEEEAEE